MTEAPAEVLRETEREGGMDNERKTETHQTSYIAVSSCVTTGSKYIYSTRRYMYIM